MPRLPLLLTALALGIVTTAGCQTYRQDLDRAQQHYEQNRFENALALFRVLEPDMDSFSTAEQAKYAYFRGMTDYRLGALAKQGTGTNEAKLGYRTNARHWLGISAAINKTTPESITDEQSKRLYDALADLDKDVFGGADSVDAGAEPETPKADEPAKEPTDASDAEPAAE